MEEKENNRFECTIYIVPLSSYGSYVCFRTSNIQNIPYKSNSYSFDYQKNSYFILGYAVVVREGNIRKTMAARGLVNGRGPRSGRDLVFRCYPPELLLTPPKKQKLTFWVSLLFLLDYSGSYHFVGIVPDCKLAGCYASLRGIEKDI